MPVINRFINNALLEIASLAADGHIIAAKEAIDDLGDTIYAQIAAAQYPKGAVVDGEKVGGQFMPKKGSSGNDPDVASAPLILKLLLAFRLGLGVIQLVNFTKRHWDDALRQLKDIPEEAMLLAKGDPASVEADWDISGRDEGDRVLAEAGLETSVDDLAKEIYQHKEEGGGAPRSAVNILSTLPRRKAAMNLLKRRDEVGTLSTELSKTSDKEKKKEIEQQITWRVGMIKAEERFGQYANKSYFVGNKGYEGLMAELKKNSKGKKSAPPKLMEARDSNRATKYLKKYDLPIIPLSDIFNPHAVDLMETAVAEIDEITTTDLSRVLIGTMPGARDLVGDGSRAFNVDSHGDQFVNVGGVIGLVLTEIGTPWTRAVIYHEVTHSIESIQNTGETSAQFIKDRDREYGNKGLRSMKEENPVYPESEKSYWDRFTNAYTGKVYEANPDMGMKANSEVVTMAIQRLAGPRPLADITNRDREQLMYALSVISKKA
jgi:hypothetical protein